jgi:hypothetical protein
LIPETDIHNTWRLQLLFRGNGGKAFVDAPWAIKIALVLTVSPDRTHPGSSRFFCAASKLGKMNEGHFATDLALMVNPIVL